MDFPIKRVQSLGSIHFFRSGDGFVKIMFCGMLGRYDSHVPSPAQPAMIQIQCANVNELEISKLIYNKRVGDISSRWEGNFPIAYRYAKIKLGDVFDFFTSPDGVLTVPSHWCSFQYVLDQYMDEDPRFKFHPSRVRQFIGEYGIDGLESME